MLNSNFDINQILKSSIKFLILLFLIPSKVLAYNSSIQNFVTQQEEEVKSFSNEALESLYLYRREVELTAYESTLKLCEGYRRAKLLGPATYHGRYMFTEVQAAEAWGKVLLEGAAQPFSAIAGLKSDFLIEGNVGAFDFKQFFQSMYTMYLIHSFEFLAAAVHCLEIPMSSGGQIDPTEIHNFANAILAVDIAGTAISTASLTMVSGSAAVLWVPSKLFPIIANAARASWFPVRRVLTSLGLRITRPQLKIAGYTLGYLLADNFIVLMQTREQTQNSFLELLDPESQWSLDAQRRRRFILLSEVFENFFEVYKREQVLRSKDPICDTCDNLYDSYFEYIATAIDQSSIDLMKTDLEFLSNKLFLNAEEEMYKKLLDGFLEVLEMHFTSHQN